MLPRVEKDILLQVGSTNCHLENIEDGAEG